MSLRDQITNAVYDHPGAPAIINAVMEVVEGEIGNRIAAAIHDDRARLATDHATTRDHLHTENERLHTENQELRAQVEKWERLRALAAEAARPDLIGRPEGEDT